MLTIEIQQPQVDSEKKFYRALMVLSKALNVSFSVEHGSAAHEESPYLAVRELEAQARDLVSKRLLDLLKQLSGRLQLSKAKDDSPFTLKGATFINPKTGKLLSRKEWNRIVADLERVFKRIFSEPEELIARKAIALGKILQGLPKTQAQLASWKKLQSRVSKTDLGTSTYARALEYAERSAAEYITKLSSTARSSIATTIIEAQKNSWASRKLQQKLFDKFAELNRDWRRIAETEIAYNMNNGLVLAELDDAEDGEDVFMSAVTAANACPWCKKNLNGRVVVMRPSAVVDGAVQIDGTTYEAVWPGKSNVGRSQDEWWTAIPAHPHCRCTWSRYYPEIEGALRRRGIKIRT
jgi:hypothetical protein